MKTDIKAEILTAKITKEGTCNVCYTEYLENDVTNIVTKECGNLIHEDMRLAFKALNGHVAIICETKESVNLDIHDPEHAAIVDKFKVDFIDFSGKGNVIASLNATKELSNAMTQKLVASATYDYEYLEEFEEDIRLCKAEILAYTFENKAAVRQLDMFEELENEGGDEGEPGDDMNISISAEGMEPIETTGKAIRMTAKRLEKAEASGF